MAQEIIKNEEVIETAEEIATIGAGKGLKIAGGVAVAALVSFVAYKVGKKVAAKIKDKKAQKAVEQGIVTDVEDSEASND